MGFVSFAESPVGGGTYVLFPAIVGALIGFQYSNEDGLLWMIGAAGTGLSANLLVTGKYQ